MTPTVPPCDINRNANSVFVSEMLSEYIRDNNLERFLSNTEDHQQSLPPQQQLKTEIRGLVIQRCTPPVLRKPFVPKFFSKLRTVAKRKEYLQKYPNKNHLLIANYQLIIYRKLQKKLEMLESQNASQTLYRLNVSRIPFTRNGWQAVSFINTDLNKYYYQMIDIDHGKYSVRLPGVYGNNECFHKKSHISYYEPDLPELEMKCPNNSLDAKLFKNTKTTNSIARKIAKTPFQKPSDDVHDTLEMQELQCHEESNCMLKQCGKTELQSPLLPSKANQQCTTTAVSPLLRCKPTTCSSSMAKEFISHVAVTGNETFLINNSNSGNKAPKRNEDTTIDVESEMESPIYIEDTILKQLKHCAVNVIRLEDTSNMVKWCMVHELYNCFCNGRDIFGKPFIIKEDKSSEIFRSSNSKIRKKYHYKDNNRKRSKIQYKKLNQPNKTTINTKIVKIRRENLNIRHNDESLDIIELLDDDHDMADNGKNYYDNTFDNEIGMNDFNISTDENQQQLLFTVLKELTALSNDNKSKITTSDLTDNAQFLPMNDIHPSISSTSTVHESHNKEKPCHFDVPIHVAGRTAKAFSKKLNITIDQFFFLYKNILGILKGVAYKKMCSTLEKYKRDSITLPQPSPGVTFAMKWSNFLAAFMRHSLFVWQVKMEKRTKPLVVTLNKMKPVVKDAIDIVNITALKFQKLPKMARMLLTHCQDEDTQSLCTLMEGTATYWLVKRLKPAFFEPKSITQYCSPKKLNILCRWLLRQPAFQEEIKKMNNINISKAIKADATNVTNNRITIQPLCSSTAATGSGTAFSVVIPKENHKINTRKRKLHLDSSSTMTLHNTTNVTTTPINCEITAKRNRKIPSTQLGQAKEKVTTKRKPNGEGKVIAKREAKSKGTVEIKSKRKVIGNNLITKINTPKLCSNIAIRSILQSDMDELHIPETFMCDHKWFVIDLCYDFTHIFVAESNEYLSLHRFEEWLAFATENQKIIKAQLQNTTEFYIFISPITGRKVYVGPLKLTADQPSFILMQHFNHEMITREQFQNKYTNNTTDINNEKTTAFWLYAINRKIFFEVRPNDSCLNAEVQNKNS